MTGTIPGVAYRNMVTQRGLAAHVGTPKMTSAFSRTPGVHVRDPIALAEKKGSLHAIAQTLATSAIVTTLFAAAPAWATHDLNPLRETQNDYFPVLIVAGLVSTIGFSITLPFLRDAIKARDPASILIGVFTASIAPACFVAAALIK